MSSTRTPGIRIDRNGGLIIDKEHRGIPIYVCLGGTDQERAEQRLASWQRRRVAKKSLYFSPKARSRALRG